MYIVVNEELIKGEINCICNIGEYQTLFSHGEGSRNLQNGHR
jgi:hypothetical protein